MKFRANDCSYLVCWNYRTIIIEKRAVLPIQTIQKLGRHSMTKLTLAILMAFTTASAASASKYLVVVPTLSTISSTPIQVTLTGGALPGAAVGKLYTVDLNPLLTVVGDPHFDSSKVVWSLLQGPDELSVVDGTLKGVLTEPGTYLVRIGAAYRNKAGEQEYQIIAAEVTITLAGVAAPNGGVNQAYSLDLTPGLSVTGDRDYVPGLESWTISSGNLPDGVSLLKGVLSGTPSKAGEFSSTITASYAGKKATTPVSINIYVNIAQNAGYRTWSDGTFAASCLEYRQGKAGYAYDGATGDGVFRVRPSKRFPAYDVFCDMTTDGGGWTLLMKQAKGDGITLQGDTTYWTAGTLLNDTASNLNRNDANLVSQAFTQMNASEYRLEASNEATRKFVTRPMSSPFSAFGDAQRKEYSDGIGYAGTTSYPNWFIRETKYPNGEPILTSRFEFNFRESGVVINSGEFSACSVRWGWASNQDRSSSLGTHDSCGGLGAYGVRYGSRWMNSDKNIWQPATLYLWAR